ncbi:hypothetical protein P152DRAFT_74009 [Eremomyces bilateralis CBS 781.70]|uniref:Velvet domain-containing protein n=1 Tax=Eremomyces bilateralis CBS 781.70 TaxID=1392243 RepID=A0A6G1FZ01_9PEZI|nr:uncharacterized protein P152DRAFT_74009 [Eremomyces bilateralis CBS 781.70]KAF1811014.1 hypothetical protein P152DRAFT_74009 [Eremomyces bilateralis CBS 781.70]
MATIQVPNETISQASRITKEAKKITYRLKVIQQPERAQACGSGAKSSADRRPVDPPPIVELRVYDGDDEVTHNYNANYFLFATLEHARTMAQGRVAPGQASIPVLTGTPVAGMAYLDRPHPAGYFIFPDLSVRHEGKYRLSFALYEELKEQKDMDSEELPTSNLPNPADAHVSHRLEVKSTPFTVFSAKKFPGLTESTSLSRMVAEQGCRVRIRRDVRMRRRPGEKGAKDWDEYEDETAYERARRTATPDNHYSQMGNQGQVEIVDRPRSGSVASNASFHNMGSRRTSMENMAQGYQASYPPPMAQQAPNGYAQPMPYSNGQVNGYQNQYPSHQTMMQPPQVPYHSQQYQQPQPQMHQSYGYPQPQAQQYPQQYQENGHIRHNSLEGYQAQVPSNDFRRQQSTQSQSYSNGTMQAPSTPYGHNSNPSSHASQPSLAPLKNLQTSSISVDAKFETSSPAYDHNSTASAPDAYHNGMTRSSAPSTHVAQSATKRSYSESFDTQHLDGRLQHGARPHADDAYGMHTTAPMAYPDTIAEEGEYDSGAAMSYRRADGTERRRVVPLSD